MVLILANKSSLTSQNEGESAIQGRGHFWDQQKFLLQARVGTREGSKHRPQAWIVDGDQLIQCSTATRDH